MIQVLIMKGADVLQKNRSEDTPEEFAILLNQPWCRTFDKIAMVPVLEEERLRIEHVEEQRRIALEIAFFMGKHPRMGDQSKLNGLDSELMHIIWKCVNGNIL